MRTSNFRAVTAAALGLLVSACSSNTQPGEQFKGKLEPSSPDPSITLPPTVVVTPPSTAPAPAIAPAPAQAQPSAATPPATPPHGPSAPALLVSVGQAQDIVDRFTLAYARLGKPRLLVYIRRETTVPDSNTASSIPTADRQTMRDLERLFGRPLRSARASLVDHSVATSILGGRSLESLEERGEAAQKDREALGKLVDAMIEVLISAKSVTVPGFAADRTYNVPDIQATVIRLSDSQILGQASSNDILGRAMASQRFNVNEITEATALALMEDMVNNSR